MTMRISLYKSLTKEAFVVNLSTVNKLYYFPGHDLISGQEVTLGRLRYSIKSGLDSGLWWTLDTGLQIFSQDF